MPNYMGFLGMPIQSNSLNSAVTSLENKQQVVSYRVSYPKSKLKLNLNQKASEKRSYGDYLKIIEQDFDAQKLGVLDKDELLADSLYCDAEMKHRPFDLPKTLYDLGKSFDPKLADIICDDE